MTAHDHDDDRLHVGCQGCIEQERRAEENRWWDEAPVRGVTFHCSYRLNDGVGTEESVRFDLELRVPDGATGAQIDERYIGHVGEGFVFALPESVEMDDTMFAMETMWVDRVVVGRAATSPTNPQPSLFGGMS